MVTVATDEQRQQAREALSQLEQQRQQVSSRTTDIRSARDLNDRLRQQQQQVQQQQVLQQIQQQQSQLQDIARAPSMQEAQRSLERQFEQKFDLAVRLLESGVGVSQIQDPTVRDLVREISRRNELGIQKAQNDFIKEQLKNPSAVASSASGGVIVVSPQPSSAVNYTPVVPQYQALTFQNNQLSNNAQDLMEQVKSKSSANEVFFQSKGLNNYSSLNSYDRFSDRGNILPSSTSNNIRSNVLANETSSQTGYNRALQEAQQRAEILRAALKGNSAAKAQVLNQFLSGYNQIIPEVGSFLNEQTFRLASKTPIGRKTYTSEYRATSIPQQATITTEGPYYDPIGFRIPGKNVTKSYAETAGNVAALAPIALYEVPIVKTAMIVGESLGFTKQALDPLSTEPIGIRVVKGVAGLVGISSLATPFTSRAATYFKPVQEVKSIGVFAPELQAEYELGPVVLANRASGKTIQSATNELTEIIPVTGRSLDLNPGKLTVINSRFRRDFGYEPFKEVSRSFPTVTRNEFSGYLVLPEEGVARFVGKETLTPVKTQVFDTRRPGALNTRNLPINSNDIQLSVSEGAKLSTAEAQAIAASAFNKPLGMQVKVIGSTEDILKPFELSRGTGRTQLFGQTPQRFGRPSGDLQFPLSKQGKTITENEVVGGALPLAKRELYLDKIERNGIIIKTNKQPVEVYRTIGATRNTLPRQKITPTRSGTAIIIGDKTSGIQQLPLGLDQEAFDIAASQRAEQVFTESLANRKQMSQDKVASLLANINAKRAVKIQEPINAKLFDIGTIDSGPNSATSATDSALTRSAPRYVGGLGLAKSEFYARGRSGNEENQVFTPDIDRSKIKQLSGSYNLLGSNFKAIEDRKSAEVLRIKPSQFEVSSNVSNQRLRDLLTNLNRSNSIKSERTNTGQSNPQGQAPFSGLGLKSTQSTILSQVPGQRSDRGNRNPTRNKVPKNENIFDSISGDYSDTKLSKAYDVFIRRNGRRIRVGKDLPIGLATKRGVDVDLDTLAASFELKESGFTTQKDINYKAPAIFKPSKKNPNRLVQQASTRLGRRSEVTEIMGFKRRKGSVRANNGGLFS